MGWRTHLSPRRMQTLRPANTSHTHQEGRYPAVPVQHATNEPTAGLRANNLEGELGLADALREVAKQEASSKVKGIKRLCKQQKRKCAHRKLLKSSKWNQQQPAEKQEM